jgi:hypothetical protein
LVQYTLALGGGKFGTSFPGRAFAGILQWIAGARGARMRYASVLVAGLVATAALFSLPAQAGERYLVTPEEIGIGPPPARYTWIPFRCTEGPADNFYHGAWYAGQPTALYRGRAYRPYYRYAAYRTPRTYLCSE